jgi:streptogramin lyase
MRKSLPISLLLFVAVIGCADGTGSSTTGGDTSSTVADGSPQVALDERLEAELEILGADFPLVTEDAVWVVANDRPEPGIVRVDPVSNEIVADVILGGTAQACNGATEGFGSIWACFADGVARIDPSTNEIVAVVDVQAVGQGRLAAGAGSIWAFGTTPGGAGRDALLRIDPETNSLSATVDLGHAAGTMVFGLDAVWLTSPDDGLLLKVDPETEEVTIVAEALDDPFLVGFNETSGLWVSLGVGQAETADPGTPTLVRIDPDSGEILMEIITSEIGSFNGLAVDETAIWVRTGFEFLVHLDPETGDVVEEITHTSTGGDVAVGHGSVWATSFDIGRVWRVSR